MAITKKSVKKPAAKKVAGRKAKTGKAVKASKAGKATKHTTKAKSASVKRSAVSVKTPFTKSQILNHLADGTELKRKDVVAVFDGLHELLEGHLSKKGPGEFNFIGLLKFRVIHKPPTKARPGINPFTGQPTVFPAKPARNVLKVRPLKKLKEIVT